MRYMMAEDTIERDDVIDLIRWLNCNPRLTQGAMVREFEREWAWKTGVSHAVFVNSGSSANLLAYSAAANTPGRLKNRRVIVPAVSWATTVSPVFQLGLEPYLCDADPATWGLDPSMLERMCEEIDPAMVVVVHVLGVPAAMDEILRLRKQYGFFLMEDACAATGTRCGNRMVGTIGNIGTFSFYFAHHLSTIEGGMVCTDDPEIYHRLLMLRSHGWAVDLPDDARTALEAEHEVEAFHRKFTFYEAGFNLRSTDLNARIGVSQMRRFDKVCRRRQQNHIAWQQAFDGSAFTFQRAEGICSIAFGLLASSKDHRTRALSVLDEIGVETRPIGGGNMSRQPFWRKHCAVRDLPMADRVHDTGFQLPNHLNITATDIHKIATALKGA